jgi:hypothetical protein
LGRQFRFAVIAVRLVEQVVQVAIAIDRAGLFELRDGTIGSTDLQVSLSKKGPRLG